MISCKPKGYKGNGEGDGTQKTSEKMAKSFYLSHSGYESYLNIKSPRKLMVFFLKMFMAINKVNKNFFLITLLECST